MRLLEYCVVVLPKLDNQEEIQLLREKYDPWFYQVQPYITIVPSFAPATLDQFESVTGYLSQTRKRLEPVVVHCYRCVERGDRLVCPVESGREELLTLHDSLLGCAPAGLTAVGGEFEPGLVVGRVPDPDRRIEALQEANRLRRTIGLIDAVSLIGIEPSGQLRLVAGYPFGIGRVDYFDLSPDEA
ncbi:MAG: hypothetical protein R6X14_04225 [bacterium]